MPDCSRPASEKTIRTWRFGDESGPDRSLRVTRRSASRALITDCAGGFCRHLGKELRVDPCCEAEEKPAPFKARNVKVLGLVFAILLAVLVLWMWLD